MEKEALKSRGEMIYGITKDQNYWLGLQ